VAKIRKGDRLTYFPPKASQHDNRHYPAIVEAVRPRIRVRVFFDGAPEGVTRYVSANELAGQLDLFDDGE
jgi:hypothetical protein